MNAQQEYVLRTISERDIRYARLCFTDIVGTLKSVAVAPAELEAAFNEGIGFDGSAIQGLTRVYESDMIATPDADTFTVVETDENPVAMLFCDITTRDGEAARSDPRSILKKTLQLAADEGFTAYVHPEIEFYLFLPGSTIDSEPQPIDNGAYFDYVSRSLAHGFRRDLILALEKAGISVEYSHHEAGPGQQEIDLRYADALTMADAIMTTRVIIREVALNHGVEASFMPKPLQSWPGSGMHSHFSLFEGENNAFHDPAGQYGMSITARRFLAGLMKHAREITAVTNQHVNSYKRLWGGGEAPPYVCWGPRNQSALVRVPEYKPNKPSSARLEYRALDTACNPYLAFAAVLRAGLAGITGKYELPEPADSDVLLMNDMERSVLGIQSLPTSLESAIGIMRRSELVADMLGEDAFDYFLRDKQAEWAEYRRQITPAERARFRMT
ncbi:glutamine synthetase [Actinobaculum suis]|uniref:Glutamine synthetase n=1 Tax=Actinobaculum suis TaxID=1657 RepID=A0A0K9ERR8_9ACTO|nr:glutamine synthetase family protein [Actinobaculum suis]KMY22888.1 glutamine synthetase [Actinobaculum suis]MDY5153808.1 glutamine synthetase family protein [Actinobaculum suis]OCA93938.1 glutamine synthetase [Actinobaculum suis]OCA94403.1 glutamine synthetase [Actinobaculum suis]SDE29221.1 glutamine synthetase [Actinobaculum suis]